MYGKTAPSAPDFDDMVFGMKLEFAADSIVFCYGSRFQRSVFVLKDAAGVGQCFIQKKLIKIVSQIVMSNDIFFAAFQGIASKVVIQFMNRIREPRQPLSIFSIIC